MKIVQVELRHETEKGETYTMTTWLDKRPDLVEGVVIDIKDVGSIYGWHVTRIYPQEHEAQDFDFHRKWDNNNYDKHKGLGV